jgi:hypothetical protein
MPPAVVREKYANTPNEYGHFDPAAEEPPRAILAAADAAWTSYRAALKDAALTEIDRQRAAMTSDQRLADQPTMPAVSIGRTVALDHATGDLMLTVYHRARLSAYSLALGSHGHDLFRIERANMAFRAALQIKTGGTITDDLCPDLPRRIDLTDEAVDCVDEFARGLITWRRMQDRLKRPAAAAAREALDDMGWHHSMRGD